MDAEKARTLLVLGQAHLAAGSAVSALTQKTVSCRTGAVTGFRQA